MKEKKDLESDRLGSQTLKENVWLVTILLLSILLRLVFLHVPFDRDEGMYAYVGQEILRGHIPYLDVVDIKPPGIYYLYALMILLGGPSTIAIRVLSALYSLGTVYFVHRTGKLLSGATAGIWAAFFFAVFNSGPLLQAYGSNTETFLVLPLLACFYYTIRAKESSRDLHILLSGLCAGIALLIKTVAAPLVLLALLSVFLYRKSGGYKPAVRAVALFIAPQVALAGIVISWFAIHRAYDEFVFWNYTYIQKYVGYSTPGYQIFIFKRNLAYVVEHLPLWLIGGATLLWLVFQKRCWQTLLLFGYFSASILAVAMPGRFYQHYFILLIPPLSILCGIGIKHLSGLADRLKWPIMMLIAGIFLCWGMIELPFYARYSPAEVSQKVFQENFSTSVRVSDYLTRNTSPTDFIFQWGFSPEIYFLANRQAASRFTVNFFVEGYADYDRAVQLLMNDLQAKSPKYILVVSATEHTPAYLALAAFVEKNYTFQGVMPPYLLFMRKPVM